MIRTGLDLTRPIAAIRQLAALPLTVLDDRVVRPALGAGSGAHRLLASSIAVLDPARTSGGRATERAASPTLDADEVSELADELQAAHRDDRFVGELAEDELRRVQAEIKAKQMIEDPEHP